MDDEQERALVRRLAERLHLSVPERRALPGGRARLSLVVDAIAEGGIDGVPIDETG
jgi:hypothetical protein